MPKSIAYYCLAALIAGSFAWLLGREPARVPLCSGDSRVAEAPVSSPFRERGASEPTRPVASVGKQAKAARVPSGSLDGTLADLEAESSGRWLVKKNAAGLVSKMSEGRLPPLGDRPESSARAFLDRFGRLVFGIEPAMVGAPEVIREAETTQVIVPIQVNGLPVYGARHNQIYDAAGNLIYIVSDGVPDEIPSSSPKLTPEQAAAAAREGLLRYLGSAGQPPGDEAYPLTLFLKEGRLMYRLVNGALSLVYRYEFPLAAPAYGDMEAVIDANMGVVVVIQNISRR